MLDPQTNHLMDSLVQPLLGSERRELDGKINKVAAWAVQAGVPGSGLALFKRIGARLAITRLHKHLAAATDGKCQPHPGLAPDRRSPDQASHHPIRPV